MYIWIGHYIQTNSDFLKKYGISTQESHNRHRIIDEAILNID